MTQDERHWDYICLTILTIETAALAAAFLFPGTGDKNIGPTGAHEAATALGKWVVTGIYGAAVLRAASTLIAPNTPHEARRILWKKSGTTRVIGFLWMMAVLIFALTFTSTVLPALNELTTSTQQEAEGQSPRQETNNTTAHEDPGARPEAPQPGDRTRGPEPQGKEEPTQSGTREPPGNGAEQGTPQNDQQDGG